jgi:CoA:oxalate CoA-transferase
MEKLGYGWNALHAKYPNLIYGAASGFGDTGPYAKRAAYDMVVQGIGGIMSMTGQPDAPPTRVGVSIGDLTAGLYLAIGVLAALLKRKEGGGSVKVDVAMLDCQVAMLEDALTAYLALGEIAHPQGSRHPEIAPFQAYKTSDSYVVIAAGNDKLFEALTVALDRRDILESPNYKSNTLRRSHVDMLESDLERSLCKRPTEDWLKILNAAGVPCGGVNTVADVAKDPQIAARNMVVSIPDPIIGTLKVAGNPIKLSGVPESGDHRAPPAIDGDRATILALLRK